MLGGGRGCRRFTTHHRKRSLTMFVNFRLESVYVSDTEGFETSWHGYEGTLLPSGLPREGTLCLGDTRVVGTGPGL